MLNTPGYLEKVYAGVLGKIIGVYLGRPYENWCHDDIVAHTGEVRYYCNNKFNLPIVLTDDDITGTITFLRAMEDYGYPHLIDPIQVGYTWLNYIIERKAILWWGGLFHSSEHTAFLRLKKGILPPESGSKQLNGEIIANQIGAQIYIDGWAMITPGDPEKTAEQARRAASVSHDDEALNAVSVIAAMESQAFVESGIDQLLDVGLSMISKQSIIYGLAQDLRDWFAIDNDWRKTYQRIVKKYGYKKFKGGCHIVPNHALILLGLLYGQGNFQESMTVVCTSGWDTDCNAGNLGCLLGIRGGLETFTGENDWRGPVADRLFVPTADGGRCISDALTEAYGIVNIGRSLAGLSQIHPKGNSRFHFELPGSTQGFLPETISSDSAKLSITNTVGHSQTGMRSLCFTFPEITRDRPARAGTATFIRPIDWNMPNYELLASPTLYPGQVVHACVELDAANHTPVAVGLYFSFYDKNDKPKIYSGKKYQLKPGSTRELFWKIPDLHQGPIYEVGIQIAPPNGQVESQKGRLYLDYLGWEGCPEVHFSRPAGSQVPSPGPLIWRKAWVNAVDIWEPYNRQSFRIIQNEGRGMVITGTRQWVDYRITAHVTSAKFTSGGIAARVQGLRRFYALLLVEDGKLRIVRALDGRDVILAETQFDWRTWQPYTMTLEVEGDRLRGFVDGKLKLNVLDERSTLRSGGIALVVYEGHLSTPDVIVERVQL